MGTHMEIAVAAILRIRRGIHALVLACLECAVVTNAVTVLLDCLSVMARAGAGRNHVMVEARDAKTLGIGVNSPFGWNGGKPFGEQSVTFGCHAVEELSVAAIEGSGAVG